MTEQRIECPTCHTSYTSDCCGIRPLKDGESGIVTIKCAVCAIEFDINIQPNVVVVTPTWFQRVILRQPSTVKQNGTTMDIVPR